MSQVGSEIYVFYFTSWVIKHPQKRDDTNSGTGRILLKNRLKGNKNFAFLLDIENCNVFSLLKWIDVMNGEREGL